MSLPDFQIEKRVMVMRGWIKRRKVKGIAATSDGIWARIRFNWPSLTDEEAERVFQGCAK